MTAVSRRKADPPSRTSAHLQSDLDAVEREIGDANAAIDEMNSQAKAVLLSGDDEAHAQHEAEVARLGRVVVRAEARREDIAAELAVVRAREAEAADDAARAKLRRDAEAAVKSVRSKLASHYTEPAETIAAFLAELSEANSLAREAGIAPPLAGIRSEPARVIEPTRRSFEAYVGEDGAPTQNPHPLKPDGMMLDRTKTREMRTFYEDVPGRIEHGRRYPDLADLVRLPHVDQFGDHHRGAHPERANRWG